MFKEKTFGFYRDSVSFQNKSISTFFKCSFHLFILRVVLNNVYSVKIAKYIFLEYMKSLPYYKKNLGHNIINSLIGFLSELSSFYFARSPPRY